MSLANPLLERAVIAALLEPKLNAYPGLADLGIQPQAFTDPMLAATWILVCRVVANGKPVDTMTVWDEGSRVSMGALRDAMKGRIDDDQIGQASDWITASWLSDIGNVSVPIQSYLENAKTLMDLWAQRRVRDATAVAMSRLMVPMPREEREALVAEISAASNATSTVGTVSIDDAMSEALADHDRASRGERVRSATWGVSELDAVIPLCRGRMIVVAAPPGSGKTSIMLNAATESGLSCPNSAVFCSLEVGPKDLAIRVLANRAKVDPNQIYHGLLTREQRAHVESVRQQLASIGLSIRAPATATIDSVIAWIRAQHQRSNGELLLVCVDYLQKISTANPRHNENDRLTEVSAKLSRIAVDLNVCVLVGSQFNREGTKGVRSRNGEVESVQPEPRASDLRGSGSIEQDANGIVGLWRRTQGDTVECEVTACVLKNREGQSGGKIPLVWHKAQGTWKAGQIHADEESDVGDRGERLRSAPSQDEEVF